MLISCPVGFPGSAEVKVSAWNVGDPGSIPELGRSPGEGNGNPLQYSCLENPMEGGAWWATVHGVAKSQTRLSHFTSQRVRHDWATSLSLCPVTLLQPCFLVPGNFCQFFWIFHIHNYVFVIGDSFISYFANCTFFFFSMPMILSRTSTNVWGEHPCLVQILRVVIQFSTIKITLAIEFFIGAVYHTEIFLTSWDLLFFIMTEFTLCQMFLMRKVIWSIFFLL